MEKGNCSYGVMEHLYDIEHGNTTHEAEKYSTRFSRDEFEELFYHVLSDPTFKARKWIIKGRKLLETQTNFNEKFNKLLGKLLQHAGIDDPKQIKHILSTFAYTEKDVAFLIDAVEEAIYQYTECGKSMHLFRHKLHRLAIKKAKRSGGKHAGELTYRRTVVNRGARYDIVRLDADDE